MKQWMMISILLMAVGTSQCYAQQVPIDLQPGSPQMIIKDTRYLWLCTRNDLDYFLDQETAKKIRHPYLKEDLWDVWIKIKANENAAYTYPETYTMEHYYVRLTMPQLQRLQTLHIEEDAAATYAPETPYREKNWRFLVPSSIEEEFYWAIVKNIKEN